jgi:ornithine--oxo-acid transaminase
LQDENLLERARLRGAQFREGLIAIRGGMIREVRGRGLMLGVELDCDAAGGRMWAERLLTAGILTKETHGNVLRLAPPLVVSEAEVDQALQAIRAVLGS